MPYTKSHGRVQCPLCRLSGYATEISGADTRRYRFCENCRLISVAPCHHLSITEAAAHYLTHQNHIENKGYVRFLNRLLQPMLPYLNVTMRGLDYGCGPGPVLSQLVRKHGMVCEDYDPLFADRSLQPPYDFIFATECFEHFLNPDREIQRLRNLLRSGGLLGIMTECWTDVEQFGRWYYTKDPTHISFYHADTLDYICNQYGFALLWQKENRVFILEGHPDGG